LGWANASGYGASSRVSRRPNWATQLGVSFQQVQKYEKGVNRVGAARLQQIAAALDAPVTFFYDGGGKAPEVESLLFLDSAFSLRLLRAYAKIKDQAVRRQMVSLMESIAANED
jgi:transcriptional regulator with XRE-family HTH domain